jgi:hypothetical protein
VLDQKRSATLEALFQYMGDGNGELWSADDIAKLFEWLPNLNSYADDKQKDKLRRVLMATARGVTDNEGNVTMNHNTMKKIMDELPQLRACVSEKGLQRASRTTTNLREQLHQAKQAQKQTKRDAVNITKSREYFKEKAQDLEGKMASPDFTKDVVKTFIEKLIYEDNGRGKRVRYKASFKQSWSTFALDTRSLEKTRRCAQNLLKTITQGAVDLQFPDRQATTEWRITIASCTSSIGCRG